MEKLKIVINGNEHIAKKAKEYFKFLGYHISNENRNNFYGWSLSHKEGDYYVSTLRFNEDAAKLVTVEQLKDLVVLKRNDVGDATHACDYPSGLGVKLSGVWYAYNYNEKKWELWGDDPDYKVRDLKPIEKPMKEYLINVGCGKYIAHNEKTFRGADVGAIEIPEGAEVAVYYKYSDKVFFWKDAGKTHWGESSRLQLGWYDCSTNMFTGLDEFLNEWVDQATVIWKRETLNDKVASAEMARQESKEWGLEDYAFAESDAFIESNIEEGNVNHPPHYASGEIECIDAMRAMLGREQFIGYLRGNMFKYQWRYQKKNGIEDLKKSEWYLNKLLEVENEL